MNHPKSPNSQLLQFMLRAQQLARQDVKTDKGYAMMMTSIITILLFSLMGAFLTMTNLAKSSTDAYIDGNNTFYAAESGLNKRAQELRARFENYNSPSDGGTTVAQKAAAALNIPATMTSCYSKAVISGTNPETNNDFECRNYPFLYNNISKNKSAGTDTVVLSEDSADSKVKYTAFTFVSDKTTYDRTSTSTIPTPIPTVITAGTYAGLNAQEYKYTVNATAAKPKDNPADNSQIGQSGENKTVLQMDFKSRTIPLFQFGAFYTRDLELNPSPTMTFNGRLHSNQKVYLTAGDGNTLSLNSIISAVTSINTGNPALPSTYSAKGTVQIQKNSTEFPSLPANSSPTTAVPVIANTFTDAEVATVTSTYNGKLTAKNVTSLTAPPVGLLSKVDPSKTNSVGEYYGKADLRLEMFPDRDVPFTLQVIKSGTTANPSCTTNGFSINNVSVDRAGYNTANCGNLSEGQLRSLMQPVLVRPKSTIEHTTFCTNLAGEVRTPPQVATGAVVITSTNLNVRERILDALALTLAAQTTPVRYSALSTPLSATQQVQFGTLLAKIIPTGDPNFGDIAILKTATPVAIAALNSTTTDGNTTKGSCFRPAPIQALFTPSGSISSTNFYDRRENRYIRMLQTNIESLTLWNRDGLFIPGSGTFTDNVAALASNFTIDSSTKLWDLTQQKNSSGNDLLFTKADKITPTDPVAVYNAATGTYQPVTLATNLFRTMGLAASDRTEGGLVFYATIDRTSATGTPAYGYTGRTSPYGFAFNDGANLPGPLTIATDQAVYSQGDWNNVDKQPASFLADTIAVLSNSCLNKTAADVGATANLPASLMGQLNCGSIARSPRTASTTRINAAFLAKTDESDSTISPKYYSGGLNNYMRILEDWTNREMNYTGSFISLGAPLEVSGKYKECNIFTPASNYGCPPNRNWSYDTSFNSYQGLPPLPPKVTELQQDSFRRKYN